MGVPMLRPSEPARTTVNTMVPNPAWLDIFRFCSIRDLGASLAVDKHWSTMGNCYHVWADAYDRTQRVDDSSCPSEGPLRSLIQRPFGEDAVGWHVAVLAEDTEGTEGGEDYFNGHIVAYSAETDTYLVAYDSTGEQPFTAWEQERRRRTAAMRHNPSLAGKSRFAFLSPPVRETGSTAAEMARCDCEEALRPVEVSSWKQELKHNVLHAPTQLWTRLEDHRDEVLFVVFSPCGTRLASCSRDLQTMVFKVSYRLAEPEPSEGEDSQASRPRASPHFELEAIFTHQTAPCRAIWWPIPPYDTVAVSTEDITWFRVHVAVNAYARQLSEPTGSSPVRAEGPWLGSASPASLGSA
ncbi:Hypothetical protein (Fragment) [Durusdinium trenchii]|uniref:Uncharacterized protein n=1 Tax=Durusdinium trenchii TaxID=1381693 RepID=A0ABP0MNX3_9DINO